MDTFKGEKEIEINRNICRLCLAINTCTYKITNSVLQDVYEKITQVKLNTTPKLQFVCFICHARLKHSHILIQQAIVTEKLLQEALHKGLQIENITQSKKWTLTKSHILNINVDPSEVREIKREASEGSFKEEDVKIECDNNVLEDVNEDSDEDFIRLNLEGKNNESVSDDLSRSDLGSKYDKPLTDSEDDLPLRSLRTKKVKPDRESVTPKQGRNVKLDAKEFHLDVEQQLSELLERSKSLNFLNSPYKCTLCYRGFRDPAAYSKHKDKHDLKSGHFECKICHLRYNTKQVLNSHSMAAHSRRFKCTICSHVSLTKSQAVVHERWHNGHQYPCKLCDKRFIKPTSYMSHMRKAHCSLSDHVCRTCGESFAGRHGLLMHTSKTHKHDVTVSKAADPTSDSYCKECAIQFLTLDAYHLHLLSSQKHKSTVWNENGSKCRICDNLVNEFEKERHARRHLKELKPRVADVVDATPPTVEVPCVQCTKTFTSKAKLQMHVRRMHLGQRYIRDVVCEVCGKHFTSNASLRYHQRAHTGERPYACLRCAARFSSREHWRLHQRVHSGEKPYACSACGQRFSQKPALNRHYIVHTGTKPFECHLCNKTFTQSASMKKHIKGVHLRQPPNIKKNGGDDREKTSLQAV